jgi:hypothetical protein
MVAIDVAPCTCNKVRLVDSGFYNLFFAGFSQKPRCLFAEDHEVFVFLSRTRLFRPPHVSCKPLGLEPCSLHMSVKFTCVVGVSVSVLRLFI